MTANEVNLDITATATKDEITARIKECRAEFAEVQADLVNGPQNDPPSALINRRNELEVQIAELKAILDER